MQDSVNLWTFGFSRDKFEQTDLNNNTENISKVFNLKNKFKQNKMDLNISNFIHLGTDNLLVKKAIENNVNTIVIGLNKDFKRNINIGKINNQKFTQIPFNNLINKIKYKAELMGLNVIITEEQYTSGTSFLDNEQPVKTNYNKSRRKFRGLFVSNLGIKINADVNQQYQILKKVFPNVFDNGIEGVVLHPVVLTI